MPKIYTISFIISIVLILSSLVAIFVIGLNLGVDFRGGSIMELEFTEAKPVVLDVRQALEEEFGDSRTFNISETGENGLLLKSEELSEEDHQRILSVIGAESSVEEKRFDSIGPVIGQELKENSTTAIILALLAIIIYIAYVFRKMSVVLSPWAMGAAAMVALFHDIVVPVGIFAVLGQFYNIEISAVFVAALLTILGYSVSDTVVIFDRVRENVIKNKMRDSFGRVVNRSVLQTLTRSLNTTFTTVLSLFAIYLFGGESLRYFSLAMIIGIILGSYSSIFIASPILFWWSEWAKKLR